jgi:peptidoglycan L-alanyl-D-glutamate endopeptidase CwlK
VSAPLLKADILFFQRILKVSKLYSGPLDGKWSSKMDAAEDAFDAEYERIKAQLGAFDPRTETAIGTLIPAAQERAREFMASAAGQPFTCKLLSGTRTYAEQNALFAIGRTVQMNRGKVTNARGGQSNHNFGIAWDVGIFVDGQYMTGRTARETKLYTDLGASITGALSKLEWGGNWSTFKDNPHYQVATRKSTRDVRALFEQGKSYV